MPHEHLLTYPRSDGTKNYSDHTLDNVPKAIEMLEQFRAIGSRTIVETTPKKHGIATPLAWLKLQPQVACTLLPVLATFVKNMACPKTWTTC